MTEERINQLIDLACSGYVDDAETALRTAVRETAEECVKVCEESISVLESHTDAEGFRSGPDFHYTEIAAIRYVMDSIRQRAGLATTDSNAKDVK